MKRDVLRKIRPESDVQAEIVRDVKRRMDCFVLAKPANAPNGFPDLTILDKKSGKWGCLEVKAYEGATHQPLQDEYVDMINKITYANFIYPENKEVVLNEIQRALEP